MTEKKCPKCGRTLPLDRFPKNKTKKDGHHEYCFDCYNILQREAYKRRKERLKQKETPKEWESDLVKQVIEKTNQINEKPMTTQSTKEKSLNDFMPREIIKHLYNLGYRIEDGKLVCYVRHNVNVKDIINS